MLYMFRTPFASIFRSTINCNSSHWCLSCCNMILYKLQHDKHQWQLLQFIVILKMDAKALRNM